MDLFTAHNDANALTRFRDAASVDAWDAWFRWRENGELRDRTIDETWTRVAAALTSIEGRAARLWSQRFVDAFASWELLPDASLLTQAGTNSPLTLPQAPAAVLNATAFLSSTAKPQGIFDLARVAAVACLATRMLDNAMFCARAGHDCLRIGAIGVADALERAGLHYEGDQARREARDFAAALSEGCLQGSTRLAAERGAIPAENAGLAQRWRVRGTDSSLIADALQWGVRHLQLSAIAPQPKLALLANNSSDALDPASSAPALARTAGRKKVAGFVRIRTAEVSAATEDKRVVQPAKAPDPVAQLLMRAAVQPWIDAPIDYPLLAAAEPDADARRHCERLAQTHALAAPQWRILATVPA